MLDLIVDIPGETIIPSAEPLENIIFTQPGMRYCQAQALVHSLAKDEVFAALSEQEKNIVSERILEEVDWVEKKFDYLYKDADWKNSRDAVQRAMQKIVGGYPADPPYKGK